MHATTILFGSSWIDTLNHVSWWRHQMETFSTLLAFCAGNSLVTGEFPAQRPLTRSFYVFFDLRLKQQLSKQWRRWWFETRSCSIWRHCNAVLLPCHHVRCMYWGHLGLFLRWLHPLHWCSARQIQPAHLFDGSNLRICFLCICSIGFTSISIEELLWCW